MEMVLVSKEGESLKDFVNRLHVLAVAKGGPVDGQFNSDVYGACYIGDVKPTDDPVNIAKKFEESYKRALDMQKRG